MFSTSVIIANSKSAQIKPLPPAVGRAGSRGAFRKSPPTGDSSLSDHRVRPTRSGVISADDHLLDIGCDGAKSHSSPVARDRDRLRQQILEGLGWRIHRLWSTDWYRHRRQKGEISESPSGSNLPVSEPLENEVANDEVCSSPGISLRGELPEAPARRLAEAVIRVAEVEGDLLDLFIGQSTEARYDEIEEGLFVRLDDGTNRMVGVILMNLTKRFKPERKAETLWLWSSLRRRAAPAG